MSDQSPLHAEVAALVEEARRAMGAIHIGHYQIAGEDRIGLVGVKIAAQSLDRLAAALEYESASVRLHRQARERAEAALAAQARELEAAREEVGRLRGLIRAYLDALDAPRPYYPTSADCDRDELDRAEHQAARGRETGALNALRAALDRARGALGELLATWDEAADCPGAGRCHGTMKWCANCGDVGGVCDARDCDAHKVSCG